MFKNKKKHKLRWRRKNSTKINSTLARHPTQNYLKTLRAVNLEIHQLNGIQKNLTDRLQSKPLILIMVKIIVLLKSLRKVPLLKIKFSPS